MSHLSFTCACGAVFVSRSRHYSTSVKQLKAAGWTDKAGEKTVNGVKILRVCPGCSEKRIAEGSK